MTTKPHLSRVGAAMMAIALTFAPLSAQTANPAPAPAKPASEEIIELSPFVVDGSGDTGYRAANTLAGTSLKTNLKDVAASVSVITREFLDDASASDLTSLLVYTTGTEASGLGGNFTSANTSEDANLARTERTDARPQFNTRVRGLSAADLTRDYFVTDIPLDSYNVDRVDINRGPNAALFGLGSPGGIINSGLKHAALSKNKTMLETKLDQYGSLRNVLDHNQVIVKDMLALRLVGLKDDRNYEQTVAMNKDERLYADLVFKPFKNTKITVNGEWGSQLNRTPKTLTPIDRISGWFKYGKPGFNASITAGADNGLTAFNTANSNNNIIVGMGDGTNFAILYNQPHLSTASVNGSIDGIVPQWNKSFDPDTNTAAFNNWRMLSIGSTAQIIRGNPAAFGLNAGQASFYRPMRIMDPSVFNFYKDNVEGPNYGGFKNFRVINAALEQTFFNNKVGVEAAYSKQVYNDGFTTHSSQENTDTLSIDINTHLPNGAVNPNFGRVYTGGNGYAESYYRSRDTLRLKAYGDLDFKDHFDDGILAKLGRHVLTGIYTSADRENHNKTYMNLRATNDLAARKGITDPAALGRATERAAWITYLSPSLAPASGMAGLGIPGITAVQNPQTTTNALLWNPVTNAFVTGQSQGLYNYNNAEQRDDLWTWGNNGTKESVDSLAFVLQSFFLSDKLVSTVSWRSDEVDQFAGSAPMNPATNLVMLPGQPAYGTTPIISAKSRQWSYGLVGHAPKFINKYLPWGLEVSAHYNSSENFNASAAGRNLYNEALPFPTGQTKEWGLTFSNEKFSLRATHFKTDQVAATVNFPGQGTLWQEMANIYAFNTQAEITASGFKVPPEIINSVNFRLDGNVSPDGVPTYTSTNPVQANIKETQDYTSKGYEIEATYAPTKQWRIAANIAKVDSITANTAPYLAEFVERVMQPLWQNPQIGGKLYSASRGDPLAPNPLSLWGTRSENLLNQIRSAQSRDGTPVTDARKYRVNLLTNYDFAKGTSLAGFSVGGAIRYQSKISIGNALKELSPGSGVYGPDVDKPFYGPSEVNFDAWVGYSRKLDFADWSLKLRVRNIGVGNELIASRANPDGTVFEARIAEPQVWEITNTFKF